MTKADRLAPPAPPWTPIVPQPDAGSYISVYLSSPVARLPVRDVIRLNDNKSDPNLETLSYGLFSTCEPIMRRSIQQRGIDEMFFVTTVEDVGRALVGRYELGWLVDLGDGDVALAARSARFIDPVPVGRIRGKAGKELQAPLRNFKIVDENVARDLRAIVNGATDRTRNYVSEIQRLERMSFARTGFRYPSWDRNESFTWESAEPYLSNPESQAAAPNTSASGRWVCANCGARIENRARLKVCNVCGKRGTLRPEGSS